MRKMKLVKKFKYGNYFEWAPKSNTLEQTIDKRLSDGVKPLEHKTVDAPTLPQPELEDDLKNPFDNWEKYESYPAWYNTKTGVSIPDDAMRYARSRWSNRTWSNLNALSQAKQSLSEAYDYQADLNEAYHALDRVKRYRQVLKDSDAAAKEAMRQYVEDNTDLQDDSGAAQARVWQKAQQAGKDAHLNYIRKYVQDNPETTGQPLFSDEDYETISDYYDGKSKAIDDGITLSTVIPMGMLLTGALAKGLPIVSNAGKAWLATYAPTIYAGMQVGSGALQGKWIYDAGKGIYKGIPELSKNLTSGNYQGAALNGAGLVLNGLMASTAGRSLNLMKTGARSLSGIGAAKLLDKGIHLGKVAPTLPPGQGTWTNYIMSNMPKYNLGNFKKSAPMLMTFGLEGGIQALPERKVYNPSQRQVVYNIKGEHE